MKTLKIVPPHRPYLVLRHSCGLTFRYKSWRALWACPVVNPYFYRSERLDHGEFRKPDAIKIYGSYENEWERKGPVLVSFSLRWDDGDPVSVGDKLFNDAHYQKERKKRQIRGLSRARRKSGWAWKNDLSVKRHVHYALDACEEEAEPRVRKKALGVIRANGYCDYDDDYRKVEKSWKSQSKRKHQWRPKDA